MAAALVAGAAWLANDRVSAGGREALPVIMCPDERLRVTASPVADAGPGAERIARLFQLMRNTMDQKGADVLSAPQVGLPERIIVVRTGVSLPGAGSQFVCMVNPRIIGGQGASTEVEPCASLPRGDWKTEVSRFQVVTVEYLTPEGLEREEEFSGADARHIQHGIDHLDGVMVADRAERGSLDSRLVAAAGIYLAALAIAVAWHIRNWWRNRREMA